MRWIFRIILGLVVLGLVGLLTLLFLPAEKIATLVEDRFQAATGRALSVKGDVRPTLWPSLGVTTGEVVIANAAWSAAGPMLRADSLSVSIDAMALIRGDIRVTGVTAMAPDILVEIGADGQRNWDMGVSSGTPTATTDPGTGGLRALSVEKAVIRKGSLRVVDHNKGSDLRLSALDADLALPSMAGKSSFDISALLNGQAARLKGTVDGLAPFLDRGAVPVVAELSLGRAKASFSGRAGLSPPAAAGRINADLADLSDIMTALGLSPVELPLGLGRERVALLGDVTLTDSVLNLRDATVTLDSNTLAGAADLSFGARPHLNAKLATGALDLSGLSSDGTGAGRDSTGSASAGWSTDRIDVSGLQAMDAKVALSAQSVKIGTTQLGRTDLYTTVDNGRAVAEIRELQAYGGRIDGSVVVNSRGGLSTRVIMNGSALAISKLFSELLGYDRLIASGDLSVNLLGVGNDMDSLMRSLSGEGRFSTGAGELLGFDLLGMLRRLDPDFMGKGSKTIFDRISASFTVTGGVMRNDDLTLLAPLLAAKGSGTVDLGARGLDYRLVARLLGEAGISVPILISGAWSAPKIRLDFEALARERIDNRALEDQAKDVARAKLEESLGVTLDPDQRLEDAVKQELEEKARKGLLKLLGAN